MLSDGFHDVPDGRLAVVVTHLEMREQVAPRPVTLTEGVTLRRVTPDTAWFRDIFYRVGGQDWLWASRLSMPEDALAAHLADPDVEVYTLTCNGTDEALLELNFRTEGQCELAFFGVTPAVIGTGAGRYLMNAAIARAWQRPITRLHLHTCSTDSPQALPFYIRSGFIPYRRQVEIWHDPRLAGTLPISAGAHVPLIKE